MVCWQDSLNTREMPSQSKISCRRCWSVVSQVLSRRHVASPHMCSLDRELFLSMGCLHSASSSNALTQKFLTRHLPVCVDRNHSFHLCPLCPLGNHEVLEGLGDFSTYTEHPSPHTVPASIHLSCWTVSHVRWGTMCLPPASLVFSLNMWDEGEPSLETRL